MSRAVRLALALALAPALTVAGCCPPPPPLAPVPVADTDAPADPVDVAPVDLPPSPPPLVDWAAAGIDWTAPPPAWTAPAFTPPLPVRFTLANGVAVYLVENHRLPLVSVRVLNAVAGSREDGAQAGLASLTADLLDQGAGPRSATELPEELERLGARLGIGASGDQAILALDTLAETLEPALAIAADVVARPRLAADDFARVKAERLADLALRPDSPRAVAGLVFERVVFGAHPYGAPGAGWRATVEPLTLADVKTFWARHYGPRAATIVIAGDITRAQLEPMLARTWGRWKGKAVGLRRPAAPTPTAPVLAFVDRPGAPQSVVTIGRIGPDAAAPGREALDVINTAVGGSFAARLNARLREELGYTYGIYATVWRGSWSGAWSVSSSLRTDVTGAGLREALAIVAAAARAPLPADELAKAKSLLTLQLPQSFETNGAIAATYVNLIAEGRPLTTYRDLPAALDAVTADGAQQAAAALWQGFTIVVVGDWAVVGKDLESLHLPIVRYDADGKPI